MQAFTDHRDKFDMQNQRVVNRGTDDRRCSLETRCGVIESGQLPKVLAVDERAFELPRTTRRCVTLESTRVSFEIDGRIFDERRARRSQVWNNC